MTKTVGTRCDVLLQPRHKSVTNYIRTPQRSNFMDLRVNFAGLKLEHPLMNAAGTCKTTGHVRTFAESAVSAVMVGSMTYEGRPGNSGDVFWPDEIAPLNALGL